MRAETRYVGAYSAVSNLVIGHDLANLLDPWKPGLMVHVFTRSEPAHTPIGPPKCKPSAIGLGLAIIYQQSFPRGTGNFLANPRCSKDLAG